jgi:hypothetical protein
MYKVQFFRLKVWDTWSETLLCNNINKLTSNKKNQSCFEQKRIFNCIFQEIWKSGILTSFVNYYKCVYNGNKEEHVVLQYPGMKRLLTSLS